MLRLVPIGLLAVFTLLAVRSSAAQETSARAAAAAFLKPNVQDLVVLEDTLAHFRTELRPSGRVDLDDRILRAEYNVKTRVEPRLPPGAAAFAFLEEAKARFGILRPADELSVKNVRRGHRSSHVTLQQVYRGVPVYNREVKVNLDREGQPTLVLSGFAPHLATVSHLNTTPGIPEEVAVLTARMAGRIYELETSTPELVVYPSDPPRLAWLLRAAPASGAVEWEVLVDAQTGEIIHMMDLSLHAHRPAPEGKYDRNDVSVGKTRAPSGNGGSRARGSTSMADGSGFVFDPDPLTSAGVPYAGPYVDGNDADTPELDGERKLVTLRDISQGADGLYRLDGPYVRIDSTCGVVTDYVAPAEQSPDAFRYTRADDYFEAVNSYYHIDKSQRYVQALDVGFDIKNEPVRVNPHGLRSDDSQYLNNCIMFGTGGIDDAEDADVIWHEYAHSLLDFTAPGIIGSGEGRAIHEGWADYWAASYSRFLSEEDPDIPPHDWWQLFTWDGNTLSWPGRPLDHPGHYPEAVEYLAADGFSYTLDYEKGMLWATTLMEIYSDVGRTVMDRLNLTSHIYIARGATFPDAAQAIIQADEDLYGGFHSNVLIERFGARGYVDPAAYGPILTHDPLEATEEIEGEVRIEVTAVGTSAPVDSVIVHYGSIESTSDRLVLDPMGGDVFAGDLPLPLQPTDVHYYVEAVDVEGRRRRLPAGAPVETYSFRVGPDAVAPTIAHDAPLNVSVVGWPMDVYAEAGDNLGVDSVWVEYVIESAGGESITEGMFGLTDIGEAYFGTFPTTAHKVQEGESVSYRIFARDVSAAGNVAVSPEEGYYHVSVVDQGVLRAYDFEGLGQGLQAVGVWQRGKPEFGLRVAHSGEHVWATNPAAGYPDSAHTSSLQLPAVDLSGIGSTYLVFWHWYDFEHDGHARPGEFNPDTDIQDAGNVKVSTDHGNTWEIVEPEGGYNGTISDQGNPLGGQPGFGGYSYGWRREIVPLPEGSDVRVRFDFGTDNSNREEALYFAGWYIDDVSITTTYPEDDVAPVASALPEARTVLVPGREDTPAVSVTVDDNTGVEAVVSEYRISTGDGEETGSIRLAMSTTRPQIYTGSIVPPTSFSAGDRIEYRLFVRDFDGNEATYPASANGYVVDFRAAQESDALTGVVSTGAWRFEGSTWVAAGSAAGETVSSLVLEPFTPPVNGESSALVLEHRFEIDSPGGGNVKISVDDGRSWMLLEPEGGYPTSLSIGGPHPMDGQGVFAGSSDGTAIRTFDLTDYAGRNVRLRLDFASPAAVESEGRWFVQAASYRSLTPDENFETTYELKLHANFPDPFADHTTITYSVPERSAVRVSVYDMLGRRVALVRHVEQERGIYSVQFDGSGLASGVYMLYLETAMGTRTERMVIAR